MLPYLTALFVLFWRWNGVGGLCFEGDNRKKVNFFEEKSASGWPGWRIFWPPNNLAPLLPWLLSLIHSLSLFTPYITKQLCYIMKTVDTYKSQWNWSVLSTQFTCWTVPSKDQRIVREIRIIWLGRAYNNWFSLICNEIKRRVHVR